MGIEKANKARVALQEDRRNIAKEKLLDLVTEMPLYSACKKLGYSRMAISNWMRDDPEWAEELQKRRPYYGEKIEHDAMRSAENVYDEDGNIVKEGNAILKMFILKALYPERYNEKKTISLQKDKQLVIIKRPEFIEEAVIDGADRIDPE